MIDHRISAGDETEGERGRKGEHGEEEHLERRHPEAGRGDEFVTAEFCTPAFATSTQRLPIVTDKFQKP